MRAIDLNSDLGEGYGPWRMGDDAAMLGIVTSANVACGGHAGDPETMFETLCLAREQGVIVGAHPGYPDREGFGRRRLPCTNAEIERFVAAQVGALAAIGALAGVSLAYVKPHGALGNLAASDREVAKAITRAISAVDRGLAVLAISGTELEHVAQEEGLETFSEIFADRGYTDDGHLVPRGQPGAMIDSPDAASARLVRFLQTGHMPTASGREIKLAAHSICIHGDSSHAVAMAASIRTALLAENIAIEPFLKR